MTLFTSGRCLGLFALLALGAAVRIAQDASALAPYDSEELSFAPALGRVEENENFDDADDDEVALPTHIENREQAALSRERLEAFIDDLHEAGSDDLYYLSEPSCPAAPDGYAAICVATWKREVIARQVSVSNVMTISYLGDRKEMQARAWDFDANIETRDFDAQLSVWYRDTKVNKYGFGSHFYQKFAILPKGKRENKDSLYTVKMITEDVMGGRIWALYKGYCKSHFLIRTCNKEANGDPEPIRYLICSPEETLANSDSYYGPNTPFKCFVSKKSLRYMPEGYKPQIFISTSNGRLEIENLGAPDNEAELLAIVGTAIKPAYDLGLWR
jgi:hypothetical protein